MRWYFSRVEQYAIAVLIVAILGAVAVLSYGYYARAHAPGQQPFFTPAHAAVEGEGDTATPAAKSAATDEVVVHVTGAVVKPGVYTFLPGKRINDAVLAAGGAKPEGYPDALNLAERMIDGEKIYIPTKAEWEETQAATPGPPPLITHPRPASLPPGQAPATAASTEAATDPAATTTTPAPAEKSSGSHREKKALPAHKVALNTATLEELQTLPGVGPATAQKIIDYRRSVGKFTDVTEIMNVSGIGPKKYEKMAPFLTL